MIAQSPPGADPSQLIPGQVLILPASITSYLQIRYPFTGLREVVKVWAVPRNGC